MQATALQFLKTQLQFNNEVISKNLAGISNEEAMIFPNGEVNNVNWVFGHLIFIRNAMIKILGGTPVLNDEEYTFYDRGAKPLEHKNEFPDFEFLKSKFEKSSEEIFSALEKMENVKPETVEDLAGLMLHEIYHAGQFGILRRILGKEGAIK